MPDRSPFQEDTAAHKVAASLGFRLVRRYRAIDVDETALPGEFKSTRADFAKISRALDEGRDVPGARFRSASTEFVLKPLEVTRESR